jgi:hypothetical protein
MKILSTLLLLSATTGFAQTAWLIRWTGANTNGTPFYWPILVGKCATDFVAPTGQAVLNNAQLDQVIKTNQAAYVANEQATVQALDATLLAEVKLARAALIDLKDQLTTLRAAVGTATPAQLRNGIDTIGETWTTLKTNLVLIFKEVKDARLSGAIE